MSLIEDFENAILDGQPTCALSAYVGKEKTRIAKRLKNVLETNNINVNDFGKLVVENSKVFIVEGGELKFCWPESITLLELLNAIKSIV